MNVSSSIGFNPLTITLPRTSKAHVPLVMTSNKIGMMQRRNSNAGAPLQNLCHVTLKPIQSSINKSNPNHVSSWKANLFGSMRPRCRKGEARRDFEEVDKQPMSLLCGLGYWVQGFRCFPWLAFNYHMAYNLNLHPSALQLMQHSSNLPMVAKPLYGILSDAFYVGDAHRIPYILTGALLQLLSWGPLALISVMRDALPMLIACILVSNLGASITEVAMDALVAEYGQRHRMGGLQSYTLMASAAGGVLGNLLGGYFLSKPMPKTMFLIFAALLSLQLVVSSTIGEETLGLMPKPDHNHVNKSISERIHKQLSGLKKALSNSSISRPLTWIMVSIVTVPLLSGCIFCYQTQSLNLNPSVIAMSHVVGQLMLVFMTVLYDRYWKEMPIRKLITAVQFLHVFSFLLDFALVRQINIRLRIPNDVFVCCFSSLGESLSQFKILPFTVLLANLCPQGCEGSLTSFFAAILCLSSIVSGYMGSALASAIGITTTDYSSLPVGILVQLVAALLPLTWLHYVPMSNAICARERKIGLSRKARKIRRIGRVVSGSLFVYRQERESKAQE